MHLLYNKHGIRPKREIALKGHWEPCVASRDKIDFLYAGSHPANKMTHNIYCILTLYNEYVNAKTTTFSNFLEKLKNIHPQYLLLQLCCTTFTKGFADSRNSIPTFLNLHSRGWCSRQPVKIRFITQTIKRIATGVSHLRNDINLRFTVLLNFGQS